MCYNGRGLPVDYVEAAKWYRLSAQLGNASAQANLGSMYANGIGMPKDYIEAVNLYRASALQGSNDGQGGLGFMYATGEGVAKDEVEGLAWTNIAATAGDPTWVKNREMMESGVGRELTIAAQLRSKDLLIEIASTKNGQMLPLSTQSPATASSETTPKANGSGA